MDFKNVPKKNRPLPFWSWNEKLEEEETARQVEIMERVGMGGFFMHARAGLETEYMGKEWFLNIETAIKRAKELGMQAWAYDENGWPSGFGGGKINGKGEQNQQKYLRTDESKEKDEHTICFVGEKRFFYEVNPFYVDTLDARVTEEFINEIYEPYYEKFKSEITGFFTDEPQISRNGIPWSLNLPDAYRKEYGEEIFSHLPELFEDTGDYKKTRMRFWRLITKLFSENYMKKIYDWCKKRGLELTGHLVLEETFLSQLTTNGAVMPHYEYFTIPGMDCLGRRIITDLTSYQLGSAAQQLGKKQVLSESFAMCGHNVSFEELKGIYEHQMVRGVNLLCQHLQGYSMRGARKRDYPPAMFYQQPWWERYNLFCNGLARIGMILEGGKCECDTLVLHPQTSAWILFNTHNDEKINDFYNEFKEIVSTLDKKHVPFHLGDEILIERHGHVEGDRFIIGEMSYKTVIVPPHIDFFENTKELLEVFRKNGGVIVSHDEICAKNDVLDNPEICYTKRHYDDFDIYYFVNSTCEVQKAKIKKGTKCIDIVTGEIEQFSGEHSFAPYESLLVLDDGSKHKYSKEKELEPLSLKGKWQIKEVSPNVLTLDTCDYYFDGELQEKNGYVLNITHKANELKRPVHIKQIYTVDAEHVCDDLCLVCETPEKFNIFVNDKKVLLNRPYDTFRDKAFKKIPVAKFMQKGKNTICFETEFSQSKEVYENIEKAKQFESELNKIHMDMEIEPCYLVGQFGVKMCANAKKLDRNVIRTNGGFVLTELPKCVTLKNIEQQGFAFFAGKMTLVKEFEIENTDVEVIFSKKGINAVDISVNGEKCKSLIWSPFKADISKMLRKGKNTIEFTIYNNLRNMMGPHHLEEGECLATWPGTFFKQPCMWLCGEDPFPWNDGYCLAEITIDNL